MQVTSNSLALEVLRRYKPKFYINSVKNKNGYENEPNLRQKLFKYFKLIAGLNPTTKKLYHKAFPVWDWNKVIEHILQNEDVFILFLNTPDEMINYHYVGNVIYPEDFIKEEYIEDPEYDQPMTDDEDISEPDETDMEFVSDQLLKQDDIY